MRYFWICLMGCVAILTCPLSPSYALDVTLAWDANAEPDLAGYGIYYDTDSGDPYYGTGASDGESPVDMPLDQDEDPDPNIVQFTLYDLPEGTYFFAVTAFNTAGLESGYSNEVSTASGEAGTIARQVSTGGTAGGGGGGGCFVATAACAPNVTGRVTYLSLILGSLWLGVAAMVRKFRR